MESSIFEIVILVIALSIDALVACFAYGTDKVKIPAVSGVIIASLSTGILIISMVIGSSAGNLLPERLTNWICFLLLFCTGVIKLFDSSVKTWIRKNQDTGKKLSFHISGMQFILTIYADPERANQEDISILSPSEAVSLGIALSLDSAAAGVGAGIGSEFYPAAILLSLLFEMAAVMGGSMLGNRVARKISLNLSWLSSILLLILAILKIW